MRTIHKILIPIFSVLLILAIVLVVLTSNGTLRKQYISNADTSSIDFVGDDFTALPQTQTESDAPILPTDLADLFYSMTPDGKVSFYAYADGAFTAYAKEVKTLKVKPELTYNKIPITIYYVKEGENVIGYGLFTTQNSDADVKAYSYVFAKLITAPSIYRLKSAMLLVNTDPDAAFETDKTYTDIFSVDLKSGACTNILMQRDRTADKSGRMTERWGMLTDGYLQSASKKAAIISGRLYDSDTEIFDVFNINKTMNSPEAKGMYGVFLRETSDSGLVYLKKTADGFKSVKHIAEEKTIASFTGRTENFVFSGDWVYDAAAETFTNLLTGKTVTAKRLGKIDAFAANADGTKFVATASYANQVFFTVDADGTVIGFTGDMIFHTDVRNLCFAGKDAALVTAVREDGTCVNTLVKV